MCMEHLRYVTDRERLKYWGKTNLSSLPHCPAHIPHEVREKNPHFRGEKRSTKRQSRGTA
jgi:hypothetical protein